MLLPLLRDWGDCINFRQVGRDQPLCSPSRVERAAHERRGLILPQHLQPHCKQDDLPLDTVHCGQRQAGERSEAVLDRP